MKKGKYSLSVLLAALLTVSPISAAIPWSVESQQVYAQEDGEEKKPSAYDEEIQTNAISGWPQGSKIDSGAAILMDANTGAVLYGKNIEKKEYPASITKIMTVLLALEYGKLDDVVTFSENAVYSIEYGSAHLGLTEGEKLTLEQCLYGIMLASANEISNAVAEHIGGSVEHFAEMMNEKAAQLGCTNTHFVNPNGLHDENHYVCAKDMALIMQAALKYDKFREIIATPEYCFPETNLVDEKRYFANHHAMIADDGISYEGALGGKTGYTDQAWNTLVTAAQRDNMELISVVLYTPGIDSEYGNTITMLDYGFQNFKDVQINNYQQTKENLDIVGIDDQQEMEKIRNADFSQEPFAMGETTLVTLPTGVEESSLTKKMDFTTGKLTYYDQEQELGSTSFTYSGKWEPETQAPTETEVMTETETETETETGILSKLSGNPVMDNISKAYDKMDVFIKENTLFAVIIGAVLLVIFIPLLFVAINRNRRYKKIMELRTKELELRKHLEDEIEEKSAAQVEAELRAQELEIELEEERKRNKVLEEEMSEESADQESEDVDSEDKPESNLDDKID